MDIMKDFINLLPLEYRRRVLVRRRLVLWAGIWAVSLVAAVGISVSKHAAYREVRRTMEAAERAYRPLEQLTRQCTTMQKELDQLHAKGTLLGQLRDERPLLTLVGVASQSARQCRRRLVIRDLLFERNTAQTNNETPAAASTPWASVTFKGDAKDNLSVATFVVGLRDSGLFRRVELKSSLGTKSDDDEKSRSYSLKCDI